MSDTSIPPSAGAPGENPPPAPYAPPAPPAPPSHVATPQPSAEPYPLVPPAPTQAYPGAAPTYAPAPSYTPPPAQPAYGVPAPQAPAYPQPGYGSAPQPGSYGAYGTPSYPVARPTSGLAITSLVCAIASVVLIWLLFPILAAVVAVITGHMALKQTKANTAIGGRGLALAGLIIGYIMLGFFALGLVITVISFAFFGAFTLPFLYSS